jgi:UDP-MurNAc hydroxylase
MTSAIRFLGQGGLDVRLGTTRLVCDPWLGGGGAYFGAWHPFPDNGGVDRGDIADAPTLFISSPNPDRFDPATLAVVPKAARVIVPASRSTALVDALKRLEFQDIVPLADWQPFDLGGGVRLTVVTDQAKQLLNAAMVLESDAGVVVSQGQTTLDAEALARIGALAPSLHIIELSGPALSPGAFDVPEGEAASLSAGEVQRARQRVRAALAVGARRLAVLDGPRAVTAGLTFEPAPLSVSEVVAETRAETPAAAARLHAVRPGDVVVSGGSDPQWQFPESASPSEDQRSDAAYATRCAAVRAKVLADARAQATVVDVKEVRSHLRDLFQFEDMTWDMKDVLIEFRIEAVGSVWVDFRKRPVRFLAESADAANVTITVDATAASSILQDKASWRDALLGRVAILGHAADRDCSSVLAHLENRHDPALFDVLRRLNPATITVQDEQNEYVCQRFCPHRGRDLEYAIVERGVLTCTAHGWRFDLKRGGKCLWGGDTPLVVKEIRPLRK